MRTGQQLFLRSFIQLQGWQWGKRFKATASLGQSQTLLWVWWWFFSYSLQSWIDFLGVESGREFILMPSSKQQSLSRDKGLKMSFFIYLSHNNQGNTLFITEEEVFPNLHLFFDSWIPTAPTTGRTTAMWMYVLLWLWSLHPAPSVVCCDNGHWKCRMFWLFLLRCMTCCQWRNCMAIAMVQTFSQRSPWKIVSPWRR